MLGLRPGTAAFEGWERARSVEQVAGEEKSFPSCATVKLGFPRRRLAVSLRPPARQAGVQAIGFLCVLGTLDSAFSPGRAAWQPSRPRGWGQSRDKGRLQEGSRTGLAYPSLTKRRSQGEIAGGGAARAQWRLVRSRLAATGEGSGRDGKRIGLHRGCRPGCFHPGLPGLSRR